MTITILEEKAKEDPKFALIVSFMEKYGYEQTFSNEKFVLYEREMAWEQ